MTLKLWTVHEPVHSNDLNLNFVGLELRLRTLEQSLATLPPPKDGTPVQLVFSDNSVGTFSDGTPILLSS